MAEKISGDIRQIQQRLEQLCENCDDIIVRPMVLGRECQTRCLVVYVEAAVSNMMLEDSVIGKFLNHLWELEGKEILQAVQENNLGISDVKELAAMEECMAALLAGTIRR